MAQPRQVTPVDAALERPTRIQEVMAQRRPQVELVVRQMVGTIVDTPEADDLGAVADHLRDVGQRLVATRQDTGLASRNKRGTSVRAGCAHTVRR